MKTRNRGPYLIDGHIIVLGEGQVVSYRDDAPFEEFPTRQAMLLKAHKTMPKKVMRYLDDREEDGEPELKERFNELLPLGSTGKTR